MVSAAIDGKKGAPGDFRDYKLRAIMDERKIDRDEFAKTGSSAA